MTTTLTNADLGILGSYSTSAPTGNAGLKARLRMSSAVDDNIMEAAIRAASRLIEKFTNRVYDYQAAAVEKVRGYGTTEIFVTRLPVISIAEIRYLGLTQSQDYIVDPSMYSCVGDDAVAGVIVNRYSGWLDTSMMRAEGIARSQLGDHEELRYQVTYAGGLWTAVQAAGGALPGGVSAAPSNVEEACYMAARFFYAQMASDPTVRSESLGAYSVSYGSLADALGDSGLPRAVELMLQGERIAAQA